MAIQGRDEATTAVVDTATATPTFQMSGGGLVSSIWGHLGSNPYFSAGAGLYTLTMAAFCGRYALKMFSSNARRKFVVSMETTNRDPSYEWLMQWLSRHPSFSFQQISVITTNVMIHANEETTSHCTFAPCPNIPHWFLHRGWPMVVYRKRQVERAAGSDVLETLEMYTVGLSSNVMRDIVAEAKLQAVTRDSDKTVIYQNAGGRWTRVQEPRSRRPLNSVILDKSSRDDIVDDVHLFLQSRNYYQDLGVPYRRGFLLHGPPGCGKSSLVMALAGELRLAICLLSLSNRALDDESLMSLLNTAPIRSIVLMEDIDRAFSHDSRVTMSGILNALDGVGAQEGRIVFMTTNHVERLDPALIRPGRADVKVEIGYVSHLQAAQLFAKFYPNSSKRVREAFADTLPEGRLSVAQIQSHLFLHRNSAEEAVRTMPSFVRQCDAFEEQLDKAREKERKLTQLKSPPLLPFQQ
jgi:mitochondrial chaperone BCS1